MDTISFIPSNQKNLNGLNEDNFTSRPYISTFILMGVFLLIYALIVGGGYWFFIAQKKSTIVESIASLDSQNSNYYPKGDLEQSFFNIVDIIQNRRDINTVIQSIESTFIPNLKVNNLVYTKKNNTSLLSAVAPTINDVTTQVELINALPEVLPSELPPIAKLTENAGESFNFIINLK